MDGQLVALITRSQGGKFPRPYSQVVSCKTGTAQLHVPGSNMLAWAGLGPRRMVTWTALCRGHSHVVVPPTYYVLSAQ